LDKVFLEMQIREWLGLEMEGDFGGKWLILLLISEE